MAVLPATAVGVLPPEVLTPAEKPCPTCGDREVRRSHRRVVERAVGFLLPLRPYRCTSCYRRHWGLRKPVLNLGFSLLLLAAGGLAGLLVVARARAALQDPGVPLPQVRPAAAAAPAAGDEPPVPAVPASAGFGSDEGTAWSGPPSGPATTGEPQGAGRSAAPAVTAAGRRLDVALPAEPAGAAPPPEAVTAAPPPSPQPDAFPARPRYDLRGLGLANYADRLEITLEADAPPPDPRRSRVEDPARWIFDLPGDWGSRPSQEIVAAHPLADTVRVGYHPDKLRLVVDLGSRPCATPEVHRTRSGVTIVLRPL